MTPRASFEDSPGGWPLAPAQPGPALDLPDANYGSAVRLGFWILAIGFGGFLAWAILAPLDEGVPAAGVVAVESTRKHIDHLTGGLIENILVREGEKVHEGQEMIILNETQAKAALNATLSQWRIAAATEARLNAERERLPSIQFPKEITDAENDPEVASAIMAQRRLFHSRRVSLEGELAIIRESVRGLELQLGSLDQLRAGREKQVRLFQEQLASYQRLNREGFVSRNQLIETERQLAEVQTKQSEDLSNIAGVKARLAEFRMRGAQREMDYRREVETEITGVQKEVATLTERLSALRDTYSRLVIRAPVSGTVVDLAFHTIGGVIKPGDRIMDIVPGADKLIVEARVSPQYIDRVHVGLPAEVHFDAYMSQAERPMVFGKVIVVSADVLTDARTGADYYSMRVAVDASELRKVGGLRLQPGMQGTVMIKTGERSLLVYLLRPLFRRFTSAMSER